MIILKNVDDNNKNTYCVTAKIKRAKIYLSGRQDSVWHIISTLCCRIIKQFKPLILLNVPGIYLLLILQIIKLIFNFTRQRCHGLQNSKSRNPGKVNKSFLKLCICYVKVGQSIRNCPADHVEKKNALFKIQFITSTFDFLRKLQGPFGFLCFLFTFNQKQICHKIHFLAY